jgi:hypothetical protein
MKFPTFEGINSTYRMEADNADIRKAIVQAVPKATEQTKEMANGFSGSNDQETCKKIFDFLKNQIRYKADGPDQIIRYPSALLKTRTGDCKSYSLLTAAILNNLKIPCRFVLQSFNEDPTPSHIYVETLSGVKCDAVYGKFNSEKPSTFQYTIPMNVKYMSGITGCGCNSSSNNSSCGCNVTSIGAVKIGLTDANRKDCDTKHPVLKTWFGDTNKLSRNACYASKEVSEAANRAKDYVESLNLKKYFGSIPRQITLGMYSMNIDGLASNVNNSPAKAKLLDGWIRLGGDPAALNRAIVDGSSKKPINIGMRSSVEKKIREILNKNKVISGVDNAQIRTQAKKILMEAGLVSDAYMSTLIATGGTFGGIVGGTVGSAIPVVGNAVGAATGGTMGSSLGYFLFEQTPNLIDAMFPVQGTTGSDTSNNSSSVTFDEKGCAFITVAGKKVPFALSNKPTCTAPEKEEDGKSSMILPILLGVGVLIALNKSKN